MVTGVGLNAPASCAAIRCAIDNFNETRFMDDAGEWIIGSEVPLAHPWRGLEKILQMAVRAVKECLSHAGSIRPAAIPLLLCVAEPTRPGRLKGLDEGLLRHIEKELNVKFHPQSALISKGRIAVAEALSVSARLVGQQNCPFCLIAGVDSFLCWPTLEAYQATARL